MGRYGCDISMVIGNPINGTDHSDSSVQEINSKYFHHGRKLVLAADFNSSQDHPIPTQAQQQAYNIRQVGELTVQTTPIDLSDMVRDNEDRIGRWYLRTSGETVFTRSGNDGCVHFHPKVDFNYKVTLR